jgi:hypothetical protein
VKPRLGRWPDIVGGLPRSGKLVAMHGGSDLNKNVGLRGHPQMTSRNFYSFLTPLAFKVTNFSTVVAKSLIPTPSLTVFLDDPLALIRNIKLIEIFWQFCSNNSKLISKVLCCGEAQIYPFFPFKKLILLEIFVKK